MMFWRSSVPVIWAAAVVTLVACGKPADETKTTTLTTTTSPQGSVQTREESRQVGSTVESKAETKVKTEEGTVKTNVETYIGTVTVYDPGKEIEVLTGENTRHAFDLDKEALMVRVVGSIAVGTHVRLVAEKSDRGDWTSVTVENRP